MAAVKIVNLTADLERAYFDYAVETITDRALPRVEDGLKPVQRRILYAMHDMGLRHDKPFKKAARVVGEVLGKYHPHGDMSVYMALVRMAQDFSLLHPLVEGQGNFGSVDGDAPAAMRYTEARLAAISTEMVQDIERGTVNWLDNFDGSLKEPEILPATLPNLLVNGSAGVAVGMATNIPPHNLGEVCDALVHVARNWAGREAIGVEELMRFIPGPDFPTGGVVYRYRLDTDSSGAEGQVMDTIRAAYETGRGRIITQARLDVEETGGGKADIIIKELPYSVQKSTVLERIAKEVRDGRIAGVTDLRDESDYSGMRVVVEVSRLADPRQVLEELLTRSQLRQTFGVISLALVEEDGEVRPRQLSLRDMLVRFVAHRLNVIERRSRHELAQREARLHIVEGLLKALDVIDEVIATIKKSRTTETAMQNLVKQFKFSEAQAQAILDMQLRRLAALERKKLQDEQQELLERIKYLKELLASEGKRLEAVVEETAALKKQFAIPRRTVILDDEQQVAGTSVTESDLAVPEGPQVLAVTTRGLLRSDADKFSYKPQPGPTSRSVEAHLLRLETAPAATVILVSNKGRGWKAPVGRVPSQASFADVGLDKDEYIVGAGALAPGKYLVMGTRSGSVKRIAVADLAMGEASWATVIGLNGSGDELLFAAVASDEAWAMFFSAEGKTIRFAANQVNTQATPSARGMKGIKLEEGDSLVAGTVVEPGGELQVCIVSQTGFAKRVPLDEFPIQGRGGQGVQSLKITKTTGKVAAVAVGKAESRYLDVLSAKGLRHRLALDDLPLTNRTGRGDRLVEFGPDDAITGAALL